MPRSRPAGHESNSLPPLARVVLRLLLNKQDYRTVASDLNELYQWRQTRDGAPAARAWLRRQVRAYPMRIVAEAIRRMSPSKGRGRATAPSDDRSASAVENLWRDLKHSVRSLVRSPVLTATILLTVGLGIGATTAIFSIINAVLIQPLPYPDAGNLVRIYTDAPPNRWPLSVADYRALEDQQTSFSAVAGYDNATATFNSGDVAERVSGKFVTWDYFSVLGVAPLHGRTFNEFDGKPESEPTVVVSHAFWSRHLGGDVGAIGQSISLDGRSYTVVGVLPPIVGPFEQQRDFFAATEWQPPPRKGPFFITALARLKPGTERAVATDELRAINRRIFPIWQDSYQDQGASWDMMDLKELVVGDVRTTGLLVFGAVLLLLLIAANNAANLLLARATQRGRELAVRAALGASRSRLLQHMLSESAVLALGGLLVGLGVMIGAMRLLASKGAEYIPRAEEIVADGAVLWFLIAVTLLGGLVFGLIPSFSGAKLRLEQALRAGGRSATDSARPRRMRRALVASQFAIAAPLLIGAGLLIGSLARLQRVDPGFDTHNILVASVYLPEAAYPEIHDIHAFWDQALERVGALPGVESVELGDALPPTRVATINNFNLEDKPTPPGQTEPATPWIEVTSGYFDALGILLTEGRLFNELDEVNSPPVVVVDGAWADRFFPNESVVGKRFVSGGCSTCPMTTVVGVVSNVKYIGLDDPGTGTIYWPMKRGPKRFSFFLVKTSIDPMSVLPTLRSVIRELDPSLPLSNVTTIDESVADSLQAPRYLTVLAGAFAAVALLLSVVGIYGVMSHHVQQHTKDIGIRIALGGGPKRVLGEVVWQGLQLAVAGVLVGMAGAFYLTRFMSNLLFGVGTSNMLTYTAVAILMLSVALVACMLPARRAAAVDPVRSLRDE